MLIREHTSMKRVAEIQFDSSDILMKFSPDGELFAFYDRNTQTFKITSVDETKIQNFMLKLQDLESPETSSKYDVVYQGFEDTYKDIGFIEHITFDQNKRFMIGYGQSRVFLLNFENPSKS